MDVQRVGAARRGGGAELLVVRRSLLEELERSATPLVLLTGPSGAGKSYLLGQWQQVSSGGFFPAPTPLDWSAGVLQRGAIAQLAEVSAALTRDRPAAQRIGGHLVDAASRLAASTSADLAKVVGKEILALVKARIGPGVGDALSEYISHLRASYDGRLEQRLSTASDPGVVEALIGFIKEVVDLGEGRPIALALDNVDRLGAADAGALLTLVDALPAGVQIRGAFASDRGEHRLLDRLRSGGGWECPVPPFELGEVESLLEQAQLSKSLAPTVERATSGLPLHARALVEHLHDGGEVSSAPPNRQFGERTREAWGTLDPAVAAVARRLAVYPTPMGAQETAALLGMELHAWSEARDHLLRAGVFSATPGGEVWFHEQRRQFVWERILNGDERRAAVSGAMRALGEQLERSGDLKIIPTIAQIAARLPDDSDTDEDIRTVVQLDLDEVAVLAALLELEEPPPGHPAVLGDLLLQYARSAFGRPGYLVEGLERLVEAGLVYVSSNEHAVAAVCRLPGGLARLVLAGRASNELGRMPIPSAASTFFELEFRPRLGPFKMAVYGVGRASMGHLGSEIRTLQRKGPDGQLHFGPPAPSLLVRATYETVDVYAGVVFHSEADRDGAAQLLQEVDPGGGRLRSVDSLKHPCPPVPSQRFARAAALLTDGSARFPRGSHLTRPIGLAEGAELRYRAEEVLRSLCSPPELMAYRLDEARRYVVVPDERGGAGGLIAQVLGSLGPVEFRDQVKASPFSRDPYARFRLAHEFNLAPGEDLGLIEYRSSGFGEDPVLGLFKRTADDARAFNKTVEPLRLRVAVEDIAPRVQAAWERRWTDALALAHALLWESARDLEAMELELVVHVGRRQSDGPRLSETLASYRSRPSRTKEPSATVRVEEQPVGVAFDDWYRTSTVDLYEDSGAWSQIGSGIASSVLADFLGFDMGEVRLDRQLDNG